MAEEDIEGGGLIGFHLPCIKKEVCLLAVCPVERVCVCRGREYGREADLACLWSLVP